MSLLSSSPYVFVGLGSNVGDRERLLQCSVLQLHRPPAITVVSCSNLYETDPVGLIEQPAFLNRVIALETELTALQLLKVMQEIEVELGRTRDVRFGPRTIDLDMLLFKGEEIATEELIVPHPRMFDRAFVLVPLLEVADQLNVPAAMEIGQRLAKIEEEGGVRLWKDRLTWPPELELSVN